MATITTPDRVNLYYEEAGDGVPVVFVHEFAGDVRSWEPQVRYFSRRYRCIAFAARGFTPSEVPADAGMYSQDHARDDILAVLDGLGIDEAHIRWTFHGRFCDPALRTALCRPRNVAGCRWLRVWRRQ